jgi:hypothetical protein
VGHITSSEGFIVLKTVVCANNWNINFLGLRVLKTNEHLGLVDSHELKVLEEFHLPILLIDISSIDIE